MSTPTYPWYVRYTEVFSDTRAPLRSATGPWEWCFETLAEAKKFVLERLPHEHATHRNALPCYDMEGGRNDCGYRYAKLLSGEVKKIYSWSPNK